MLAGFATPEGTTPTPGAWRGAPPPVISGCSTAARSSLGSDLLGGEEDATDAAYRDAVVAAVAGGVNVIDTAVNYRFSGANAPSGKRWRRWWAPHGPARGRDSSRPRADSSVRRRGAARRTAPHGDSPARILEPQTWWRAPLHDARYLRDQIDRVARTSGSRRSTSTTSTIRRRSSRGGPREFDARMRAAFATLERRWRRAAAAVRDATWNGYRQPAAAPTARLGELVQAAARSPAPSITQ